MPGPQHKTATHQPGGESYGAEITQGNGLERDETNSASWYQCNWSSSVFPSADSTNLGKKYLDGNCFQSEQSFPLPLFPKIYSTLFIYVAFTMC